MLLSRIITWVGLGPWACRIGLHDWEFGSMPDEGNLYTYCWCARDCDFPLMIVDIEEFRGVKQPDPPD